MEDIFSQEKIIWEQKIRAVGSKFESVFNTKLPEHKICFTQDMSYVMQILNSEDPIVLNVNIGFMLNENFHYESYAAHEFTHMCDYAFFIAK